MTVEAKGQKTVVSLGDLLRQGVSVGSLATAIEEKGISHYDRFGRFVHAKEAEEAVFKLLEDMYRWTIGEYHADDEEDTRSPLELSEAAGFPIYDRYGWLENELPDFEKITIKIRVVDPLEVKEKKQKASVKFVSLFIPLLIEIARRDKTLDVFSMPGIKDDLHALAKKHDIKFNRFSEDTFDDYIEGFCKFRQGSSSGNYYKDLFPEYFKRG